MSVDWVLLTPIAAVGLAIGSFLNVVIYRVPREESIVFGASRCTACKTPMRMRHNIPVLGWLLSLGRCTNCASPISMRYPLVEAGTAVLFTAVALRFGLTAELPAYLFLAAVGVTCAMIDFDVRRLPDSIVLPAYVISALLLMPAGASQSAWWPAARAVFGALTLSAIYFTLALAFPGGVTFGDVKLAGLLGLYLGWLSWAAVLIGALGGLFVGGLSGSALNAMRARSRHRTASGDTAVALALGPCMVVAAGAALFVTVPITTWYGSLVGAS